MPSATGDGADCGLSPRRGLSQLIETTESLADLRRKKLTQVDVLSAAPPLRSLNVVHVAFAFALACCYVIFVLPCILAFGVGRRSEPRAGGPYSDVSLAFALVLSSAYIFLSILSINRMALRRAPVQVLIFECMAVHNITQCLFNAYCFVMLLVQGRELGLRIWGNETDLSERGHELGRLIWLQYHCRQLQLFETGFMILRKKFQGVSFLHLYLRLLNLFGWYIACRRFGGGEAFFPALISSLCQAFVYGLYFSFSLEQAPRGSSGRGSCGHGGTRSPASHPAAPISGSRAGRIFELQITQYVLCAIHSIGAAIWGNFPLGLALLHLFVIANGLVLYTDFHSDKPGLLSSSGEVYAEDDHVTAKISGEKRVTFSFDSCGWLFVYHFGVAAWLSEHIGLEVDGQDAAAKSTEGIAFSGSSGGSLVACTLGAGTKVQDVFEFILEQFPACRKNPLEMFPAVERALCKFQYPGAHKRLTNRVRILLTRVLSKPPFVMGEVADCYPDNETAVRILRASCHVPLLAGLRPLKIGDRYYYDGLVWPSRLLVPWRGAKGDFVVRISACAAPVADIRLRRVPFWWAVFPPSPRILRGMFWCGYRDAAKWFSTEPVQSSAFDACKCRRAADGPSASGATDRRRDASNVPDEGSAVRWAVARALLRKEVGSSQLPERDPVSGDSVETLVALAETMADRQSAAVQWFGVAAGGALIAVAAVAMPALLLYL